MATIDFRGRPREYEDTDDDPTPRPRPSPSQPPPSQPPPPQPRPGDLDNDYLGTPIPDPYRAPSGVPQGWADDFLRRNPGDFGRVTSAYGSGGGRGGPQPPSDPRWPAQPAQFTDPYTQQYEGVLGEQMTLLRMQQEEMRRAVEEARRRRAEADTRRATLETFINERVGKLKGPAYTGSEQEVLRTQLLDPIERDRSAAQRRALERISARGLTPESGIAADLQRLVDEEFNQMRTGAQGGLAQRQIEEQRSREQEAQQLLTFLMQLPDAATRGDLDFLNTVQGYVSQPGTQRIAVGDMLAELPTRRLNDALRVLGVGPTGLSSPTGVNTGGMTPQMLQLLQLLQNNRAISQGGWGNFFGNLGTSFRP